MRIMVILALALPLGGCLTDQAPAPAPVQVSVQGPVFPASRFACGGKPVQPDPGAVGTRAGSAAASYEDRVETWGQRCDNRLQSVRRELQAAGQVAAP
jgi:hypothetical protein